MLKVGGTMSTSATLFTRSGLWADTITSQQSPALGDRERCQRYFTKHNIQRRMPSCVLVCNHYWHAILRIILPNRLSVKARGWSDIILGRETMGVKTLVYKCLDKFWNGKALEGTLTRKYENYSEISLTALVIENQAARWLKTDGAVTAVTLLVTRRRVTDNTPPRQHTRCTCHVSRVMHVSLIKHWVTVDWMD